MNIADPKQHMLDKCEFEICRQAVIDRQDCLIHYALHYRGLADDYLDELRFIRSIVANNQRSLDRAYRLNSAIKRVVDIWRFRQGDMIRERDQKRSQERDDQV